MLRALIFISIVFVSNAFAQIPSEKGRLGDGRAYRTGDDGFKIVDQVAELEVTTDDLRRQIIAMEDELEEKNRLIERLGGAKLLKNSSVKEKDLLNTNTKGLPPARTVLEVRRQEQQCGQIVADLNKEVTVLRGQLDASADADTEIKKLRESQQAAIRKNSELETKLASLRQEVFAENEKRISIDSQNDALEQRLAAAQKQEAELKNKLAAVETQAEDKIAQLEREATIAQGRAKLAAASPKEAVVEQKVNTSRDSKEFKPKLQVIQKKILTRKSYLDKLKRSKKGISINARRLETASGISLDDLRVEISKGGRLSDTQIRKALLEIEQILNQDIKTASRLAK